MKEKDQGLHFFIFSARMASMFELLLLAFWEATTNKSEVVNFDLTSPVEIISHLSLAPLPHKKDQKVSPKLLDQEGLAVLAQDIDAGKTLFKLSAQKAQPIASLTKIMTYLVLAENHDLDAVVTISEESTKAPGASIDLYAYEKLKLSTLLEAILIPSANDAALALAIWDAGSEADFVEKMNDKAKSLGLDSAIFYNSTGLDIYESGESCDFDLKEQCIKKSKKWYGNLMSAQDALKMTRIALNDDFFRETVAKDHFYGQSVDEEFLHEKPSTNKLLGSFINSKGVKTGFTTLAGQCFINLSELANGNEVITVILGSSDRFTETKNLMDWILGVLSGGSLDNEKK